LAAEIRQRFPEANVELLPSGKGRFEVVKDGTPVFEKSKVDRHAAPGEIVRLLAERA
jgi:hypothetical protein